MKKFLFKLLKLNIDEWLSFGIAQYKPTLQNWVNVIFNTHEPTLEQWVEVTNKYFEVEEFKAAAYNYRIKQEAAMADELGIGDAFRWGSETAKAEQEALEAARGRKKVLPGGILALGKTPEERRHARLMERDDLLITSMVKAKAAEVGVDPILE